MSQFELLEFDTTLFGFNVAKILPNTLSVDELQQVLQKLKDQQVRLVYWATDADDLSTQEAAIKAGGVLVDRKMTYVINLAILDSEILNESRQWVEEYPYPEVNNDMRRLAIQIAERSRFGVDPNMPKVLMEKMYETWMTNCIKGNMAKHVFVIRRGSSIAGMVTLGEKNGRGDIGLISVSEKFQGHGLGTVLVHAAQAQFLAEGYQEAQVVTQMDNQAACKLYETMGFHVAHIENFYHFWRQETGDSKQVKVTLPSTLKP